MSVETLAHALLEAGILDAASVEARVPRVRSGRKLLDDVIADGISTESSLVSQLARALSVPRYDPKERQPEPDALALLDLRSADELGVLPVAVRGGGALVWVAMCDPTDETLMQEVQRRTGRRVKACLIGPRELARALQQLQGGGAGTQAGPPTTGQYRAAVASPPTQPPMQHAGGMPGAMPLSPLGYGAMPGMLPNGMGAANFPSYGGYPGAPQGLHPQQVQAHAPTAPPPPLTRAPMPPAPALASAGPPGRTPDLQRLEDELAQAKQVVKVLAQLLVERGVIDGEELKRRLRAERDRK